MILEVKSESGMKSVGERIGSRLKGGQTIELIGDVGAGKTTFVKGLAKGIGISEDVQSPSYTISRVYDAANDVRLAHYDFYRLTDAGILMNELSENQADDSVVTVVEWADIVDGVLPEDRLQVKITVTGENSRNLELSSKNDITEITKDLT